MKKEEIEALLHREDIHLASIAQRGSAFFLDELLLSLLVVVAFWNSFTSAQNTLEIVSLSQQLTVEYILLKIAYHAFFVYKYGATLGKMAMKIKVIQIVDIDKPSLGASINRAIIRIVSEMLFYLGFAWGMMDPLRRTWHDVSAKTLVIKS